MNKREFQEGDIVQFHDGSWAIEIICRDGKIFMDTFPSLAYQSKNRHLRKWKVLKTNCLLPLGYEDDSIDHEIKQRPFVGLKNTLLLEGLDTGTLAFAHDRNIHLVYDSNPATITTPSGKTIPLSEETWSSLKNNI